MRLYTRKNNCLLINNCLSYSRINPLTNEANESIDTIFKIMCSQENDIIRPKTFTHFGRNVSFNKTCGQILDSSFDELCDRPLGASDYSQIANYFHTIMIRDVPQMNLLLKGQARRFITLIDTLYDNRVRVVISSPVSYKELFETQTKAAGIDEHRVLMDDLNIKIGDVNATSSIFTGDEEMFAFDRAVSRLAEMQTPEYWTQWEKHR